MESWLMGILVIQPVLILFFIAATFFRKPFRVLITGAFIRLLIIAALIGTGVHFGNEVDQVLKDNWQSHAGKFYYDQKGNFISALTVAPMLCITFVNWVEIAWDNCHKPADIKKDEACEMEEGQAAHAEEPQDLGP